MVSATKTPDTADGGYEYGTDDENDFNSVYFYFYKDGTYVSYGKGESQAEFEATAGTETPVEELWKASDGKGVVVIESNMHSVPNQLLCVINSPDPLFFRNKSLNDALAALTASNTLEGITGVNGSTDNPELSFAKLAGDGSKVYFTMMNSPEIVDSKEQYALPFDDGKIYKDSEGGTEAAKNDPVEVYVERIATKASVDVPATVPKDASLDAWDITIDAWGLNGVSQNGYAVHKIDKSWKDAAFNTPAFVVGPHRTNWAIDPDYDGTNFAFSQEDFYPRSAREYGFQMSTDATTERTVSARFKYWSMNEIKAHSAAALPKYDKLRQMYCLENTFDAGGQNDYRHVGTHVVVLATAKPAGQPAEDLFMYMGTMFTKANYETALLGRVQTDFGTLYTDAAGTTPLAATDLEIKKAAKHPDFDDKTKPDYQHFQLVEVVSGTDKGYSDGYVTLYPKDGVKLYKESATPGTFLELTAAEKKEAFLKDIIDIALHYKDGAMWYCVPIEHLGKAKSGTDLLEGNYGMVRNHWYKVTISRIDTFGHGISDPDEPIVPDEKTEKWYLAAKINVNAWHIVNQSAVLAE